LIEGFWLLIKRCIMGSFHKVSRKYLPLYVAEFQFRYNNRENADIFGAGRRSADAKTTNSACGNRLPLSFLDGGSARIRKISALLRTLCPWHQNKERSSERTKMRMGTR
jgi:hypothetical protein